MDAGGDRLHSTNIAVIREVYDSEYSQHGFSIELEKALHAKCSVIVIEPTQLGDETARWITFGNYIHKTAVLSGLTSCISGFVWPNNIIPQGSLCIGSLLTTALYTASWQFDHCVKYQDEIPLFKSMGDDYPSVGSCSGLRRTEDSKIITWNARPGLKHPPGPRARITYFVSEY